MDFPHIKHRLDKLPLTQSVVIPLPYCHENDGNGVDEMERIDVYAFYKLALDLRGIFFPEDGRRTEDVACVSAIFPLVDAARAIDQLLAGDPVALGVSKPDAQALSKAITIIRREHFQDSEGKFKWPEASDPAIPTWQWNNLRSTLDTFETVFHAEMRDATTYQIPECGIYSTPRLVNAAEQTFSPALLKFISEKSQKDFNAAGRCLAFNLLTAAGFHVVRAVEGTLEIYYKTFTGKGGTLSGWKKYIDALDGAVMTGTKLSPDEKTINVLRQMKDDYRNPVVHPRVVLSEIDARIVFSNGEAAIMGMAQEIKKAREHKKAPPAIAVVSAS